VGRAFAADPVSVEIVAVEEQEGRMVVTINVTGADGLPVRDALPAAFKADLSGVPLSVSSAFPRSRASQAIAVVLAVDVSGSMAGDPIVQARRALADFIGALERDDAAALIAFGTAVQTLQPLTADKNALLQAVGRLAAQGDTALYDAVGEAVRLAQAASAAQKVIILLSDGMATVNIGAREASLAAAAEARVPVVSIGLGPSIDEEYLATLAEASKGRFLRAPDGAALRRAYSDLAAFMRGQYVVTLSVPAEADRSVAGHLVVSLTQGGFTARAERTIEPLAGARPPVLPFTLTGISAGQEVRSVLTLLPKAAGADLASVEYVIDGATAHTALEPPFSYALDPALVEKGVHVLKVIATDRDGRRGETQVAFSTGAAAGGSFGLPVAGIVAAVVAAGAAAGGLFLLQQRRRSLDVFALRVRPWSGRFREPRSLLSGWEDAATPAPAAARRSVDDGPRGVVQVLRESPFRGDSTPVLEIEVGTSPLTLGASRGCDIALEDEEGRLGPEEARLWVSKRRLIYHRLTTLSAMATEGVTEGWVVLEDRESLQVGPYRLVFLAAEEAPEAEPRLPPVPPISLRDLWPRYSDESGGGGPSSE
jgi:Mg-chelatase subunit ChlD